MLQINSPDEVLLRVGVPLLNYIKDGRTYEETSLKKWISLHPDLPLSTNAAINKLYKSIIDLLVQKEYIIETSGKANRTQIKILLLREAAKEGKAAEQYNRESYRITQKGIDYITEIEPQYPSLLQESRKQEERRAVQQIKDRENYSRKIAGTTQEISIYQKLVWADFLKYHKILKNVVIKNNDGTSIAEIDVLILSSAGIFVIESKHLNGVVTGKSDNEFWYVTRNAVSETNVKNNKNPKQAIRIPNPILQNKKHIQTLLQKTHIKKTKIISLIVYSDQTELRVKRTINKSTYVLKTSQLVSTMKKIIAEKNLDIKEEDIDRMYNLLRNH